MNSFRFWHDVKKRKTARKAVKEIYQERVTAGGGGMSV
jgi:hypothetical protein